MAMNYRHDPGGPGRDTLPGLPQQKYCSVLENHRQVKSRNNSCLEELFGFWGKEKEVPE